jgi:hypothetical protein
MHTHHVRQRFHSVGHGTFLTGVVVGDGGTKFSWVYDCGSRRSDPLKNAMAEMEAWDYWPDPVDMVVLSHFDDDHVNGIENLLKNRRVGSLILPYSDWQQRLRDVAIGGQKGISASTAHMQLDPAGWLESRNLAQRVDRLVLIRGGRNNPGPDAPPGAPFFLPRGPQSEFNDAEKPDPEMHANLAADLRMTAGAASNVVQIHCVRHQRPMQIGSLPMEFMFYNAELSGSELGIIESVGGKLVARKSGLPLSQVRTEVEKTIAALGLVHPFASLPLDWRAKLKACYQNHFGSTGKAKNNISLCMNVRPLPMTGTVEPCSIFHIHNPDEVHIVEIEKREPGFDFSRPALLCTGDLKINKHVISAMQSHFGASRWALIGVTQVPHHGSEHSWDAGNAAILAPSAFVHCAPGSSAHPHPDVKADLAGWQVFMADYKKSVILDYHFLAQ